MVYRFLYHALIGVGRPFGGVRPRRLYDVLGRRAYPKAEYAWVRNKWGAELKLSHHFHLDRNTLIFGEYDAELHRLIEGRLGAGMVALDVGANLGEMALHMAKRVGETGRVFAFEPYPAAFGRLAEHVARNGFAGRVMPLEMALGDVNGRVEMAFPEGDADNQGLGSLANAGAGAARREVECQRLDDFVKERGIERVDFIKLDIQGGEYGFLAGARETLMRFKPAVVMEISPGDLQGVGKTSRDLVELVEGYGYAVHLLEGGEMGRAIAGAEVAGDFAAVNVLCLSRVKAGERGE